MAFKPKRFLKAFARSRNFWFAMEFAGASRNSPIESFRWRGMPFFYRPKTSDAFVAYECFLHGKRNAYFSPFLPAQRSVKTIVDVGANIGGSVLFWKSIYPEARIHCFEPIPSNVRVLERNCAALPDVTCHNEALGDVSGEITFIHSPAPGNEGGWSVFQRGAGGNEEKVTIPITRSGDRLHALGISQIDILKVDTEGAEKMIIEGLGQELLARTDYICGELHGERDFELLDFLEQNGFRIGVKKSPKSVLFNFEAIRLHG
ncbi:MAG: FkbM family methyltransferase [Pseudomonadota bacterium]